ncbi:MAG: hypothetical protein JOY71_09000 [Acetobacteraceae bacterium]|nr:hypothetical protein [Acetobacteraceae bacterium]
MDEQAKMFALQLAKMSGLPLIYAIDERKESSGIAPEKKISITKAAVESLGLFAPINLAWLCGDYIYYLARKKFPNVSFFWLIEHDVRFLAVPASFSK